MYTKKMKEEITKELENIKSSGRFKVEKEIAGAQGPEVKLGGKNFLMFASNNYLGLANHPEIVKSAKEALEKYGFGLSSVRFISGTETIHKTLEKKLADFLGMEDAILYSTNFMANLGFFASLTNESLGYEKYQDVIYSDELNHASIIDAFKLCKKDTTVKRIYPHDDLDSLQKMLEEDQSKNYRFKIIATDGVFSMEGSLARLSELKLLAEKYEALLFVDDAHGVGVIGQTGGGTPECLGLHGQIDVLSGTFGKALGGAIGGYISGRKEIIELLRQKSRTYTFSNSIPPLVIMATTRALELLKETPALLAKASENARYFRTEAKKLGFNVGDGLHPIVPVTVGDIPIIKEMSKRFFEEGLYVVGLWFPIVPEGTARFRFQVSAAHTKDQLDRALAIMAKVGREMALIK